VPLEMVIEFKRGVYQMALTELSRYLPRAHTSNRFLRTGSRPSGRRDDADHPSPPAEGLEPADKPEP